MLEGSIMRMRESQREGKRRVNSRQGAWWCAYLLIATLQGCATTEIQIAEQLAVQGDWDGAVNAYREALKRSPTDQDIQQQLERAKGQAADMHFVAGQHNLEEHQIDDAILEYKMALGLNPAGREYHAALMDVLQLKEARDILQYAQKLRSAGRLEEALAAYERVVQIDPDLSEALEAIGQLTAQARSAKGFGGSNQPVTLRFQNVKLKEVFEILTKTSGISVVFDKEVKDDPITMFIKDMPTDEALNLILNTNGLVAQRIGTDMLLIIPNTKPKLAQYQDLMIRTFYLSNAKAKDAVNLIRTMFESKRVYVDEKINAIVMREEPAKLQLAERVLQSIDRKEPEVQLDVEILEVDRSKSLKYGVNFAKTAGAGVFPDASKGSINTAATRFTFQELTSIGTGSYLFTIPGSVLLDFFKNDTNARTLASPKLRVLNNKQASIQVGDKQPILLSTTNVLPGQAATGAIPTTSTVTSIEFKDVGVKLTVEPVINLTNELTLKLKVEVTRLGDQVTLQASPEIKQFRFGTRTAETVLMMGDDETIVLGGLIQDDVRKTRVTVPFLGDIPYIGYLFSTWTEDTISTEVVLTITPHIIRTLVGPVPEVQAFWSGTEANYSTSPLFTPQATPVSMRSGSESNKVGVGPALPSGSSRLGVPALATPRSPVDPNRPAPASTPTPQPSVGVPPAMPGPVPDPSVVASVDKTRPEIAVRPVMLRIRPAELTSIIGAEVQCELMMAGIPGSVDSSVTITYNPQVLELLRTLEGDLVTAGSGGSGLTVSAGSTPGSVSLNFRQGGDGGRNQGVIAKLVFAAKSAGLSPMTVQAASVKVQGGTPVSVMVEQGLVTVQ